jgi:hypothetical protein
MILEYSNVLEIMAEVSITLAGFMGVILIVQRGDRNAWHSSEKNTMFHLLYTSLGVFGLSLLPLLIQPAFVGSITVWRICCPVLGLVHFYGSFRAVLENRRNDISVPSLMVYALSGVSIILFPILTFAIALGYLLNFAALVYLTGLGWLLSVAVSTYATLLFRGAPEQ